MRTHKLFMYVKGRLLVQSALALAEIQTRETLTRLLFLNCRRSSSHSSSGSRGEVSMTGARRGERQGALMDAGVRLDI
jgi:hypothetical protein